MGIEKRLKELRKRRGYTQDSMAKVLDVKPGTYRNWEQGLYRPDNDMIIKIANTLDTTTDYLFGLELSESERRTMPLKTLFAHDNGQLENMSDDELYDLQLKILQIMKDRK